MKIGSLFSGISGLDLAVERTGIARRLWREYITLAQGRTTTTMGMPL